MVKLSTCMLPRNALLQQHSVSAFRVLKSYPDACTVDTAGIDLLLVTVSVAMVVHGHDTAL